MLQIEKCRQRVVSADVSLLFKSMPAALGARLAVPEILSSRLRTSRNFDRCGINASLFDFLI